MKDTKKLEKEATSSVTKRLLCAIYEWYLRVFCILDIRDAEKKGLRFYGNVYGDEINRLNCRSVWLDSKGRRYRVKQLGDFST